MKIFPCCCAHCLPARRARRAHRDSERLPCPPRRRVVRVLARPCLPVPAFWGWCRPPHAAAVQYAGLRARACPIPLLPPDVRTLNLSPPHPPQDRQGVYVPGAVGGGGDAGHARPGARRRAGQRRHLHHGWDLLLPVLLLRACVCVKCCGGGCLVCVCACPEAAVTCVCVLHRATFLLPP